MSNRGGLRLGFGGKRTKRAAKKSEGTHLTPRKDEPLTVRCAKSLAEALSEQSDDVEEWGAVVCSWPAAALERVLPLLPARVLLRLHAAFGGISPAAHDVLGDGAVLERAIQRDEKRENGLVDVFAGDAAGAPTGVHVWCMRGDGGEPVTAITVFVAPVCRHICHESAKSFAFAPCPP